jgi:hypothetical protein
MTKRWREMTKRGTMNDEGGEIKNEEEKDDKEE